MIEIFQTDSKNILVRRDNKDVIELNVHDNTLRNKFFIISNFVENLSRFFSNEFDDWFENFLLSYKNNVEQRYYIIDENIPKIKEFVNRYLSERKTNYSQFVDIKKSKKSSIFFYENEIENIIKMSHYLKIYSFIFATDLKLDKRLHKSIYNKFSYELVNDTPEVCRKLFDIVKTKTFKCNLTDKYMWDYVMIMECKSVDVNIIEIFNFIMNTILVLTEEDKNPITYFVSVVNESIKWFLVSVYAVKVLYDDSISSEDISGAHDDNLLIYSYNDTMGKLKSISLQKLYELSDKTEESENQEIGITELQNRVSKVEFISPLSECLVYPILSAVTDIPYSYFRILTADHTAVLSVYLHTIFKKVFGNKYENMTNLLLFYPKKMPSLITTYKLKDGKEFINSNSDDRNFFGFPNIITMSEVLKYFIGRISRCELENIITGSNIRNIPISKIESDMFSFFTLYFSGNIKNEIKKIKEAIYQDF